MPSPIIGANTVRCAANASCAEAGAWVACVGRLTELESGAVRWEGGGDVDGRRFDQRWGSEWGEGVICDCRSDPGKHWEKNGILHCANSW